MSAQDRLRSIRLSLRFIAPLAVTLALLAYALVPLVDRLTLRWWVQDLDTRSQLIANTMQEQLGDLASQGASGKINLLFMRALQDERLYALAFCDESGKLRYETPTYPRSLGCNPPVGTSEQDHSVVHLRQGPLHVVQEPVFSGNDRIGSLILVHDMSFVERRSADTRRYLIGLFVVLGIVISLVTVFIAQLSWRGWVAGVRVLLRGEGIVQPFSQQNGSNNSDLHPLASDLRALLREIDLSRRNPDRSATWSPDMLRGVLREKLLGDEVIVVSNREPFIHVHTDGKITVRRPASGLVTAMEPVMRACSGTWIAHGSGDADRETVDKDDRIARAARQARATRCAASGSSPEEEKGYYYGFANEGMWPLCHVAHVRPVFRASDWEQYLRVNRRFARCRVAEARTDDPVVLVQDYHFALLPRMMRERCRRRRSSRSGTSRGRTPESFGICPWREEMLDGMLGSTILGFHTRFHCQNFIETVDRYLEARIEHEHSTISHGGQETLVERYPISIEWPPEWIDTPALGRRCAAPKCCAWSSFRTTCCCWSASTASTTPRASSSASLRSSACSRSIRSWIGRFVFVQVAAPSRSTLDEYQTFQDRVRALAERDQRSLRPRRLWQPVLLGPASRRADRQRALPRRRRLRRDQPARRHEPRLQGVRRRARRRAGRADAFAVRRRRARAARGADRQSVSRRGDRGRAVSRADHAARRAARAHAQPAAPVREFNVYRWAGAMLIDAAELRQRQRISERIDAHQRMAGVDVK